MGFDEERGGKVHETPKQRKRLDTAGAVVESRQESVLAQTRLQGIGSGAPSV